MGVAKNQICQVTEEVWSSVLGLALRRGEAAVGAVEGTLVGCVQVTGSWEGAVTVESSAPLARKVTAILLGVGEEVTTPEEIRDAIGELTNIIGGNIKGLLPGPSQLSLPAVVDGREFHVTVPGSHLMSEVAFECEGHPLRVAVLRRDEGGHAKH